MQKLSRQAIRKSGKSMLSAEEILAKQIAQRSEADQASEKASGVSSCGLLISFGRKLFAEKIRPTQEKMLPGLGGDFDRDFARLVTLCCPSDFEPVALGLCTNARECSCSVSIPTPTASDWKGGKRKRKQGTQANLRDAFTQATGLLYLHPEDLEAAQGFPTMWTELDP